MKADEKQALQRAAALCSKCEYCVSQIVEKLNRWEVETEAQERIVCRLLDEGFIDEARFAKAYAYDKLRYNHWGRVKIDQMLRILHIDRQTREQALCNLPDDEYRDILRKVLQSKQPSIKGKSDYECRMKLMRFLVGRGFELDVIREALDCEEE